VEESLEDEPKSKHRRASGQRHPLAERKSIHRISKKIVEGEKKVRKVLCPHCGHHKAWASLDWDYLKCCWCGCRFKERKRK
jgi:ribosomal protein L32